MSKMIDYKLETFPKILQIIKNVTFDLTDKSMESFDLQVIAMDNAMETGDFLDELGFEDEDFEDEDFEDEDFDDGFFWLYSKIRHCCKAKKKFCQHY